MDKKLLSYIKVFTLFHVLIYWFVGSVFYQVSGYEEALATMELFEHWRSLESLGMVAAVFLGQIFRGILLAVLIYPFYKVFMDRNQGWILLFGLLFGLKVLGSPIFITEFIASTVLMDSLAQFIESLIVGVPEIITQTLLFAIVFYGWEKRKKKTEVL
mgnify:CR=1 FL=1